MALPRCGDDGAMSVNRSILFRYISDEHILIMSTQSHKAMLAHMYAEVKCGYTIGTQRHLERQSVFAMKSQHSGGVACKYHPVALRAHLW